MFFHIFIFFINLVCFIIFIIFYKTGLTGYFMSIIWVEVFQKNELFIKRINSIILSILYVLAILTVVLVLLVLYLLFPFQVTVILLVPIVVVL
jgi:hypothetical protein